MQNFFSITWARATSAVLSYKEHRQTICMKLINTKTSWGPKCTVSDKISMLRAQMSRRQKTRLHERVISSQIFHIVLHRHKLSMASILDAILMNRGRTHFESVKFTAKLNNYTDYWRESSQNFHVPFLYKNIISLPKSSSWHPTIVLCIKYIDKNINFPHVCSGVWMFMFIYNQAGALGLHAALEGKSSVCWFSLPHT